MAWCSVKAQGQLYLTLPAVGEAGEQTWNGLVRQLPFTRMRETSISKRKYMPAKCSLVLSPSTYNGRRQCFLAY